MQTAKTAEMDSFIPIWILNNLVYHGDICIILDWYILGILVLSWFSSIVCGNKLVPIPHNEQNSLFIANMNKLSSAESIEFGVVKLKMNGLCSVMSRT